MLRDRLLTSSVLIVVVLGLLLLDYRMVFAGAEGIWLLPLLLFFAIGTSWEISAMLRAGNHPINPRLAVIGAALLASSAAIPYLWVFQPAGYPVDCPVGRLGWIALFATVVVFTMLMAEMRIYGQNADVPLGLAIGRTCSSVFVSMYVGLPMAMLVGLRCMHASPTQGRFGFAALVTAILVTKVADAGAYFSGKSFGRRKLIPRLSPGKTVEGSLGGIAASTIVAYVCLSILFPWLAPGGSAGTDAESAATVKTGLSGALANPLWGAMLLGPTLAISGMVGDLAESLFKRDSGVKDSGNLLPGLGGVWDVTDSLIAAAVPAFFCFAAGVGA